MDAKELIKDAKHRMDKSLENFQEELAKVRTGRANPALLDTVKIDYYGQTVPVNQAATVTVPEPRLIVVQPWEKSMIAEIENAILKADLGRDTPAILSTLMAISFRIPEESAVRSTYMTLSNSSSSVEMSPSSFRVYGFREKSVV